jgi:hypothetical protein
MQMGTENGYVHIASIRARIGLFVCLLGLSSHPEKYSFCVVFFYKKVIKINYSNVHLLLNLQVPHSQPLYKLIPCPGSAVAPF